MAVLGRIASIAMLLHPQLSSNRLDFLSVEVFHSHYTQAITPDLS
jgi:hypothetical protein